MLALAAAGSPPEDRRPDGITARHGGSLTIGLVDEPVTLNPYIVANGIVDTTITNAVNDPLFAVAPGGAIVPVLAARVPTAANGLVRRSGRGMVVELQLRQAARWSDGTSVSCQDLRFTWQALMDRRWVIASRRGWQEIQRVECRGGKRALVHFSRPYAQYLDLFRAQLLPSHDLRGKDFDDAWRDEIPVSSGPFLFERWDRGRGVTLRRNPTYWRAGPQRKPYLERIRYSFVGDPNTLAVQLSTGGIDVVGRTMSSPLRIEETTFPRAKVQAHPALAVQVLGFNHARPLTRDPLVRQALAYAIDREQLVEVALQRPFEVLDSLLVPENGSSYSEPYARYRPDPGRVADSLRRAGFERTAGGAWTRDGKPLRLVFKSISDKSMRLQVGQLLQQQLAAQGIGVDIVMETPTVFYGATLRSGSWDIVLWGNGVGLDPLQRSFLHCSPAPGRRNASRYCNRRVSALIDEAVDQMPGERKVQLVRRVHDQVARDLVALPLVQDRYEVVHAPQVHGVVPSPVNGLGWNAADWWIEP